MKKITMFSMGSCPYCQKALRMMDALFAENPDYKALDIEKIDETLHPEIANNYDYYYAPTYYVGGIKLHEGAATIENIRSVFDAALGV